MAFPLAVSAGLKAVALTADELVVARVAHVAVSWRYPLGGGVWSMSLPVAVVDSRRSRRRVAPVIDPMLALVLATGVLALAGARRKGGRRDDGGEQASGSN